MAFFGIVKIVMAPFQLTLCILVCKFTCYGLYVDLRLEGNILGEECVFLENFRFVH